MVNEHWFSVKITTRASLTLQIVHAKAGAVCIHLVEKMLIAASVF